MTMHLVARSWSRRALLPLLVLFVGACASAPPPPSQSAGDPSNPNAAEAPASATMNATSSAPSLATNATADADVTVYACPMHPEVTATEPGHKCPKCGMTLVPRKANP
jgi:hypothetical protein